MVLKKLMYICLFSGLVLLQSCLVRPENDPQFVDDMKYSIYEYVVENKEAYSSFLSIMEKGGIDITLSAYNPFGNGYTLFLPDNEAIERFISNSQQFASIDELLDDQIFTNKFCRYHVINMRIRSNDFPFGAFPQKTLSEDFLTVSFFADADTSFYKINNQSRVILPNIERSNGYVHHIEDVLEPITYTTYEWLERRSEYSIFKSALDLTGLDSILNLKADADEILPEYTLLIESDAVFKKAGINNISDLENIISPDHTNYIEKLNPLYNFIAYHILTGNHFIDDFEGRSTLYTTLADVPIGINGEGLDIAINKGKQVFDTIIIAGDTTYMDFVGVKYDDSNVLTKTGAIHFIDQVMTVKKPSRESKNFQFMENSFLNDRRNEIGTYYIEDKETLEYMDWSGADLYFVVAESDKTNASGNNYLEISGDFTISYQIEPMIPGQYSVEIRSHNYDDTNAIVEVYVDGRKISGIIDLTKGGNANTPFRNKYAGAVNFSEYKSHVVEIRTLIPGKLLWDAVNFKPI